MLHTVFENDEAEIEGFLGGIVKFGERELEFDDFLVGAGNLELTSLGSVRWPGDEN